MIKFDFSNGWTPVRLEYLCEALRGVTFSSNETFSSPASNLVACLTTGAIQDEIAWETRRFIPHYLLSDEKSLLREGDILVSTANSKELVGKSCLVEKLPFASTFGAFVTALRVTAPEIIDPFFLSYYLRVPTVINFFYAISAQTTSIANLRVSDLLSLEIPLPPLPEQQRIVAILRQAADLRRQHHEVDELAQTLLLALFNEIFGDPATNPKKWPVVKAGDLMVSCEYGSSQKASEINQGTPIIRMNNVTYDGNLRLDDLKYVTLSKEDHTKYALQPGDVLFNRTNSKELVGKTAMWNGQFDAIPASYFIRVRFDQAQEHPLHFVVFMNSPYMKRRLMEMARGAIGQSNINAKELQSIQIPRPPIQLQEKFAAQAQRLSELSTEMSSSSQDFKELFDSLLARAFTGNLTSIWRQRHESELSIAAQLRDEYLQTRSASIPKTETRAPITTASSDKVENILLEKLSRVQQNIYALIKSHDTPYFTVQTLWQEHTRNPNPAESSPLAKDMIESGIKILEALGFIAQIKLLSEPTGGAFYQSVYRLTSAPALAEDLRSLKDRYPNIHL